MERFVPSQGQSSRRGTGVTATHSTATHVVDLADLVLEPDAIARIPRSLQFATTSIASVGRQITIAVLNPDDQGTIDRVQSV
jgi:hypothetical protein